MKFIKLYNIPLKSSDFNFVDDETLIVTELVRAEDVIKAYIHHVGKGKAYVRVFAYNRIREIIVDYCYDIEPIMDLASANILLKKLQNELNNENAQGNK